MLWLRTDNIVHTMTWYHAALLVAGKSLVVPGSSLTADRAAIGRNTAQIVSMKQVMLLQKYIHTSVLSHRSWADSALVS